VSGGLQTPFAKKGSDVGPTINTPLGFLSNQNQFEISLHNGAKTKIEGPSTGQL
jgi:hypothetical protein